MPAAEAADREEDMELNILLVDDEYFVLKGMEIMLGEQKEVPLKIMTAMDAVDAFDKLTVFHPDVIIADINMPEIDGLTMLERLAPEHSCKYIIVSGYEDQEYLKRALKLHVADYLTKPVDKNYLLRRLKEMLKEKEEKLSHTRLKLRLLLFSGDAFSRSRISPAELDQFLPFFRLFLFTAALTSEQAEKISSRLQNFFENVHVFSQNNLYVFLLNYSAPIREQEMFHILKELLPASFGYSFFEDGNIEAHIPSLFLHYQEALARYILFPLPVSEDTRQIICRHIFQRTLKSAVSVIRFDLSVAEYINGIYDCGRSPEENFLLVFTEALAAYLLIAGIRLPEETILQLYQTQLPSVRDKRSLSGFLERTLNFWYDSFTPTEQATCSSKVVLARQYIDLHYMKDLALEEVAESVSVNPSYLSYIFRKETGITFLQYLTNVRLLAACRLLTEQPGLSLEDVAARVGYHSASYFHKIFRSHFGVSPRQWKPGMKFLPEGSDGSSSSAATAQDFLLSETEI